MRQSQKTVTPRAWAELGMLALIWGGSFLAVRVALDEIGPLTSVLHRCFWAMLLLWAVVAFRRLRVPRAPRVWGAFLMMGLLNNVVPFSLMAWGQLFIESGLTSIFNAATAIWGVLIAAMVFSDERLSWRKIGGVTLGFAGVATAIGVENLTQVNPRSLAQIAVIAGTVSYACASVWARATMSGISSPVAAAGMLTGSSVVMVPLVLAVEGVPTLALQADTWLAICYYALMATALAYLLYYRVLAVAGSGNLMLVTLLIPPVAIVLGAWARDEALTANALAGFALLALGLALVDGRLVRRLRHTPGRSRV